MKRVIKTFDVYTNVSNREVTECYVSVIEQALKNIGITINHIGEISKKGNENKGIIAITPGIAIKAKKANYGTIIYWAQGVVPEESFLRHQKNWDKHIRQTILSFREKYALMNSDFVIFVSNAMLQHFRKKYNCSFRNYYIMPCFNEEINKAAFLTQDKYTANIFTYAGSIAPWQCFEPTVKLFSEIEKKVPNSHFRVLVKNKIEAMNIINKYGVKNYSIDFVPVEKVKEEMSIAKFGFCLRENTIINNVSTPTKLSSYISNGVMPIFTPAIKDFYNIASDCPFCHCVDYSDEKFDSLAVERIIALCQKNVKAEDVYLSFIQYFGEYYSAKVHSVKMSALFCEMFL